MLCNKIALAKYLLTYNLLKSFYFMAKLTLQVSMRQLWGFKSFPIT